MFTKAIPMFSYHSWGKLYYKWKKNKTKHQMLRNAALTSIFFSIRLKSPNKQFFDQICISLKNYASSWDCCVKLSRIKYSANISIHNCNKEKPYLCYILFCPIHSNVVIRSSGHWFWMTAGSTGKHMYESLLNFSEILCVSSACYSELPMNWTTHLFNYFPARLSGM